MRLVFYACRKRTDSDGRYIRRSGTFTHTAKSIELSKGDQGIVDGFELVALCGATSRSDSINLFEDETMFPACPECQERL